MNNDSLFEIKSIKDKIELDIIKRRLEEISTTRESLSTKDERIMYDIKTKEEANELMSQVRNGIVIDDIPYKEEIFGNLYSFFGKFGLSYESISSMSHELEFFISDINLGYGGKLVHACDRIGVDSSYANFDESGKFIGFKEELKDFFIHTFTHEFLHKLSSKEEGKDVVVMDDPIIEGFTDMFAHMVSGKREVVSDTYEFPEKVCELFAEMMGIDKAVDDYLNHNQTHPNLHNLFLECGCEEFSLFNGLLSNVMNGVRRDKKNGVISCFALEEKDVCLAFLRDNILIPYCVKNSERSSAVLEKFNNLFGEYGYTCSMEDVKESKK